MIFIKTQCSQFVSKTWSWLKGTFLPEYSPPNSTVFVFAWFEYSISGFQLKNSYGRVFFFFFLLQKVTKTPHNVDE